MRGSRLSLQVEVAGGRLSLHSGRLYEVVVPGGGPAGERRFFPASVQVRIGGAQAAEYRLLPMEGEGSWHERTHLTMELDQRTEWRLSEKELEEADGETWRKAPVRVTLRRGQGAAAGEETPWRVYLETGFLGVMERGPGTVQETSRSELTRVTQRFPLVEGTREGGAAETLSEARRLPVRVRVGGPEREEASWHSNLVPPELTFERAKGLPTKVVSQNRIVSRGAVEQVSVARVAAGSEGGFGGSKTRFSWKFEVGVPPDVGTWEAADADASSWVPVWGAERTIRVHLTKPDGVEEVRFRVTGSSRHRGVAVNALHDHLLDRAIRVAGKGEVPVALTHGETRLQWQRNYPVVVSGPRDEYADLFFEQARNPAGQVEGEVLEGGPGGLQGTELRFTKIGEEIDGKLTVGDWAATGTIAVEALIDGLWEPLRVKGPGAQEDEVHLQVSPDRDGDGFPDGSDRERDADEDGDGLTAFEEYRGIVAGGMHRRLDPAVRDVFLLDYSDHLSAEQRGALEHRLQARGIRAHWLAASEHDLERIGQAGEVIVLERLGSHALPRILRREDTGQQLRAWRSIRPRPGLRTIFADDDTEIRWLARDVLRVLGVVTSKGAQG